MINKHGLKLLLSLLLFWVLSLISFAASAALIPLANCPAPNVTTYFVNNEQCYDEEGCIQKYIKNYSIDRGSYTEIYTYLAGSASSTESTITGSRERTYSCNIEDCGDISQVTVQTFTTGLDRQCDVPPDPDPETDCSDKSTVDSQPAIFNGPNTFSLSGCFDGCEMKTESNQGGDAVTVRKVNSDGTVTARAYYSGTSCGESNSVDASAGESTIGQVSVSAPTNGKVLVQDLDTQLTFEVPDPVDTTQDIEPEITPVSPSDTVLDVVSSVDDNGTESQSVIDNEPAVNYDELLSQLDEYVVVTSDQNGLPVMLGLNANSDPAKLGGGDGSGSGGGTGTGSGDGTGTGEGTTDIDLSGVESRLDDLLELSKSGSVTFSGSCTDPAPICDDEKPFCQQLKADYELKCSEVNSLRSELDLMTSDPFGNGSSEITTDINLVPILSDITQLDITGSCPSDINISYSVAGRSLSAVFSSEQYCNFATTIRPLILFIGIFMVIRIFSRI